MSHDAASGIRAEQLVEHTAFVRAIARAILAREDLADDAVQDTFVAALGREPRENGRLRSWLGGVVRNKARDIRRREARRRAIESHTPPSVPLHDSDVLTQRAEMGKRIVSYVLELPEPYRHLMLLRFHSGLPLQTVATMLNVSVETVRTRQRRALKRLRHMLDEHGSGERDWMAALTPLTFAWPSSTTTAAIATVGGALVVKKVAIGVSVVLLLSGGGYWAWRANSEASEDDEHARESVLSATREESKRTPTLNSSKPRATRHDAPKNESPVALSHFAGTLLDESGKPVPDAWIEVKKLSWHKFDASKFARVVPNDAGAFAFDIPKVRSQLPVRIHSKTHVSKWGGRERYVWPGKTVDIVLTPAIHLHVLVLDEDSGNPVSGANVSTYGPLTRSPDEIRGMKPDDEVRTSAEGLAIVRSKAGQGAILVRAESYRTSFRGDLDVAKDPDDITIEIGHGGTVRGRIVDESGNGQAGVAINAIGFPPYVSHVVSDEHGRFVLHDTPIESDPKEPLDDYNLMVWVQTPGSSYGRYIRVNPPAEAGDAVDVTITWLDERPMGGRVLLPNGKPGSQLTVTVLPEHERRSNWAAKPTTSDRNGRFRFEKCLPGRLRVQVRRDSELSAVIAESVVEHPTTGEEPFVEIQLTEQPPGASPVITVNLLTHDGKKIDDGAVSWSVTRPQGTVSICAWVINGSVMTNDGVRPRLLMWADAPGYAPHVYRLSEADVGKGEVDLRLPSGTATGRVTRLDGTPVKLAFHASVRRSNPETRHVHWHQGASPAQTDEQGRFVVRGLGDAKYRVRPTNLVWRVLGGHIELRAGQRDVEVLVGTETELRNYFVEAVVVDAETNAPVVDWTLRPVLVQAGAAADSDAVAVLQVVPGSKRLHRTFDPVAPGIYDVVVPAKSGRREARATGVRVGEGLKRPRVTLTWERGLSITGRVVDDEGRAAKGVQVKAGAQSASVKQDGTYRVSGLEAGTVDVRVSGPYVEETTRRVDVQNVVGATADFRVVTGGAIRIWPASSIGPTRRLTATARPERGGSPVSLTLTADEYEIKQAKYEQTYIRRLTPGRWHIDVDWDGKRVASETVDIRNRETTIVKLAPR